MKKRHAALQLREVCEFHHVGIREGAITIDCAAPGQVDFDVKWR